MNDGKHAGWIAKKVKAMLSHYPSNWNEEAEVKDLALDDWVDHLSPYSQRAIEAAIAFFVQSSRQMKPTPGEVRAKAHDLQSSGGARTGDRRSLSSSELFTLEDKVLPTAHRWVQEYAPSHVLHQHGKQTLGYWGEVV